jgi:hypothetical protein
MNNKTCGECKYFKQEEEMCLHSKKHYWSKKEFDACASFEEKPITNGDKIRQGGDYALIDFADGIRRRMLTIWRLSVYAASLPAADRCGV